VTSSATGGGREHGTSQVQSVDRAIAILYLLAQRGEAGVTEVAAELGVHKSTAFRLITALDTGGLIEQDGERGKYRLGRGILRLAAATAGGLELPTESRQVCRQLAAELGEAVNLAILDGAEATNILQEYGTSTITGRNWIGQRTPLHATASGKVLLAWMDAVALKEVLASTLQHYTAHTVAEPAALEAELATVRDDEPQVARTRDVHIRIVDLVENAVTEREPGATAGVIRRTNAFLRARCPARLNPRRTKCH